MIEWMEGELLLKIVLLILDSNWKLNLTNLQRHKYNRKIILGQKIKAKKVIMGWREYYNVEIVQQMQTLSQK